MARIINEGTRNRGRKMTTTDKENISRVLQIAETMSNAMTRPQKGDPDLFYLVRDLTVAILTLAVVVAGPRG